MGGTPQITTLQICRSYAKHGVCSHPETCIYDHPPPYGATSNGTNNPPSTNPPHHFMTQTAPSETNLAPTQAWEAAGQYFEPVNAVSTQGPVCQHWIQTGACPYGVACQYYHPPLSVQFPKSSIPPPSFPPNPQMMFQTPHKLTNPINNVDSNNITNSSQSHTFPQHAPSYQNKYNSRKKQLCKNVRLPGGCKFGDQCLFYHPPSYDNYHPNNTNKLEENDGGEVDSRYNNSNNEFDNEKTRQEINSEYRHEQYDNVSTEGMLETAFKSRRFCIELYINLFYHRC